MITPVQQKLVDMLSWFHDFCKKNDITYYAAGGTVIGAFRHNGFIPWDDDIDVVIPRDDYNRLIQLFQKKRIDHYYLESPYDDNGDYLYSYAKLYDTDTTVIEESKYQCKRGIYIDVFPLDNLDDEYEMSLTKFRKVGRKNMFLMMRTCVVKKERAWYKNLLIIIAGLIPKFFLDEKKLAINLDINAQKIGKDDAVFVANLMGRYGEKEIIKREWLGKPTLHEFEGIQIYVPEKHEKCLNAIYGDWKVLPPENKRVSNHSFVELNLNKSYM